MYELAMAYGNRTPVPLRAIAAKQGLSENYLEQLMVLLREAGMVSSVRGAKGGYVLTKHPSQITVGDIIRVMEGEITPTDCVGEHAEFHHCGESAGCVARGIWEKVKQNVVDLLDGISLMDLCEEARGDSERMVRNEEGLPGQCRHNSRPAGGCGGDGPIHDGHLR